MIKTHDLLKNVLIDIEEGIRNGINADIIARKHNLSEIHLRRLFRFAFNEPISGYIRSRALTESLNDLLHTDKRIIDIALVYGFGYEQSYSRSFRRKFGISPSIMRNKGQILKTEPHIHFFTENYFD